MPELIAWPPDPPTPLGDLSARVADELGATLVTVPSLSNVEPVDETRSVLAIVHSASGLRELEAYAEEPHFDLVAVVSDGYLGTDGPAVGSAMYGGAAVTVVRSVAVRQGSEARANVVCIPESLFGEQGSQRGPLRQEVEIEDVAHAVAFFLDPSGGYLNGQVLFADGGRHVFSSMSA
ncbi:MAG: SDR family oxidoreductase [Acidimicrobiia bacterium]